MNVKGLSGDLFGVNNPILITIDGLFPSTDYVTIYVYSTSGDQLTAPVELYLSPKKRNIKDYDISELIRSVFDRPQHPDNVVNGNPIETNYIKVKIDVIEFDEVGNQLPNIYSEQKTFIRGGEVSQRTNVTFNIGQVLSDTVKLPLWGGLPIAKYYIDNNKRIAIDTIVSSGDIQKEPIIGCDPFYVRFLNIKGGYSFWMFPVWEQQKKAKGKGYVLRNRPTDSFSLGHTADIIVKAESRLRREQYAIAESLIDSPEIHVYNRFGMVWAKIEIEDSVFVINTYEDMADLNVSFSIQLNNDRSLI